jgi:hypothetical protein
VQRRVNGCGDRIVAEGAERIHGDDVVFAGDAFVAVGECKHLVEIERGKAGALDAAEIAAGAFDPEDLFGLTVEGIDLVQLGAGVASAEVGDAQVGTEQVGTISKELWSVEVCCDRLVLTAFEKAKACMRWHFELLYL